MDKHNSLAKTFPIFIKASNAEILVIYEIYTVPVHTNNSNKTTDGYSAVTISKPYITINDKYYIQLCIPKPHICKHINYEYFHEKLL